MAAWGYGIMKDLLTLLIIMGVVLAAWAVQERTALAVATARWCGRLVKSQAFINVLVVATAALPVIGLVVAFWTGEWRWLALLFALCLFL